MMKEKVSPLCNAGEKLEGYGDKANVHTAFFASIFTTNLLH